MKKLITALVATSALVSQASADVRSGFYLGADVSANALLAKGKWSYSEEETTTPAPGNQFFAKNKSDLGRWGVGAGVFVGYGAVIYNCYYFAGELAYNYDSANPKHTFTSNFNSIVFDDNTVTQRASLKVKNEHAFNFAALLGGKLTPSTILYIRLGGNVRKIDMTATIFGQRMQNKKTRLSFAPGFGMETSMGRNCIVRLEYSYDLGQNVKKSITSPILVPGTTQTFRASTKNVDTHSVKLGIAYKI